MVGVIIYNSKHGCTKKISERIAKNINFDLVNLVETSDVDFSKYDSVIVGSSVYAGNVNKRVKSFISKYKKVLLSKKLGLFIIGLNEKESSEAIKRNYDEELRNKAIACEFFLGEIVRSKLNFLENFAVNVIMKSKEDICKIDFKKIENFAKKFKD